MDRVELLDSLEAFMSYLDYTIRVVENLQIFLPFMVRGYNRLYMAGGSGDWNTLLEHQREMVEQAKGANLYSKIAAVTGVAGLIVGLISLFK